jgi:hypothetical protein
MPQDGSGNYQYPLGTRGVPDETIESAAYNNFLDDLVGNDLNTPRPIHRGGTGATTADAALVTLGAEKAAQLVTNYDTHVWFPGSFRSAGSATGGPVDGHAFAGIAYINEALASPPTNANVTVSARDTNDTTVPGTVYVREKKTNVWGAWTVVGAATLPFPPSGGITSDTIAEAIQELDTKKVGKAGGADGVMTGYLTLNADPSAALHPATKQYVDTAIAAVLSAGTLQTSELRFLRASSQYMTRTFVGTSSLPWTISMWVRRNSLATHQALFGVKIAGNEMHVGFNSLNQIGWFSGTGGTTELGMSTMTFTNVGLWLNIIWSCPTAGATPATKTWNLSVNNGLLPPPFTMLGTDPGLNSPIAHYLGQAAHYPDVWMKEIIFVDGSEVPATSFGVDVAGVWTPKAYAGSYGPHGFRLAFNNQLSAANLGIDSSPNGNHWTAVNF